MRLQPEGRKIWACRRVPTRRERGAIAIMAGLTLMMLLAFGAFAIDFAYAHVVKNEIQNAADAAALNGAVCVVKNPGCNNDQLADDALWKFAEERAAAFVDANKAEAVALQVGVTEAGFWSVSEKSFKRMLSGESYTPSSSEYRAVRVVITKSGTTNGGGARAFLSRLFGVTDIPMNAVAVAIVSGPSQALPGGAFPVVISECMYNLYWDSENNQPKLADATTNPAGDGSITQTIGEPWLFNAISSYHAPNCWSGQWTSFKEVQNNVTVTRDLIENGNPVPVGTGDDVWLQPGTKASLYNDVDDCSARGDTSCEYRNVLVVTDTDDTHEFSQVVAVACVRILQADGGSQKSITMQMVANETKCPEQAVSGGGPLYGVSLVRLAL